MGLEPRESVDGHHPKYEADRTYARVCYSMPSIPGSSPSTPRARSSSSTGALQELFGLDPEEVREQPVSEVLQVRSPSHRASLWPPISGNR